MNFLLFGIIENWLQIRHFELTGGAILFHPQRPAIGM